MASVSVDFLGDDDGVTDRMRGVGTLSVHMGVLPPSVTIKTTRHRGLWRVILLLLLLLLLQATKSKSVKRLHTVTESTLWRSEIIAGFLGLQIRVRRLLSRQTSHVQRNGAKWRHEGLVFTGRRSGHFTHWRHWGKRRLRR